MLKSVQRYFRRSSSVLAVAVALTAAPHAWAIPQQKIYSFNIPAENSAQALMDFSRQADIQILFPYAVAAKHTAPAVVGAFDRDAALKKLIAGSGLEVAQASDTAITLKAVALESDTEASFQVEPAARFELVVTGTHIRGGSPTSPVHTLTRRDIEQSGYGDVGALMRSLPENFAGGQNPGVFAAAGTNVANVNVSGASTVNLRGLGTDATLVLLNGHRLAYDGYFQASDISGIPLAAVQRIEVVPDGASALYGSDAVGGVANFILRRNYTGGEVSARYGGATQGGGAERMVSALGGKTFSRGYLLANLEYSKQDAILATQRSFTSGAMPANTLLPEHRQTSLFVGAGADLTDRLKFTGDVLIGDRATAYSQQSFSYYPLMQYSVKTPSYSLAASLDWQVGQTWSLQVSGLAAGSRNSDRTFYPAYKISSNTAFRNAMHDIEVTAGGTLFTLPSGDIKVALGAGQRRETFTSPSLVIDKARDVAYVYGELDAPLVTPSADRTGLHALELNLSARSEDYSDVGRSTNPRFGLRYVPFNDLTLRASWGRSFKAPTFLQLYGQKYLVLRNASDVGGTGTSTILMTQGSNPDLKPERSTSVTIGGDYRPAALPSLSLSANVFDIRYTDRVVTPINNILTALSDPIYAPFVDGAPSLDQQQAELARANTFYNFASGAYDPARVTAFLRNVYTNATSQRIRGADISYRQGFQLKSGSIDAFANATWLDLDQQTLTTLPYQQLSGTIFNAPKWKARGGLSWQGRGLSATAIVNYIGTENDVGVKPAGRVGSWTTLDANLGYRFSQAGALHGVKLGLAISNLFDKMPRYAQSAALAVAGIHFDSTNASAIGRFVSLTAAKAW